MTITQHKTNVNGLEIAYYCAGEQGSPVVLLHGGGTDSAMLSWREAIPALAAEHRVFAPDWPGYGDSQVMPGPYRIEALVDCLDGLLDHWELEKASLVGLSMGGGAAIGYTLAHPLRVEHLVLVDPYGLQKQAPSHRMSYFYIRIPFLIPLTWKAIRRDRGMARTALSRIFANEERVTEAMVDEVFASVQDEKGGNSFYSFQRHEITWNGTRTYYTPRMVEIQSPTLFIHGEKDTLVPLVEIRAALETMPSAHLEVMADTGHWPPREYPEKFNQIVLDFLRRDS